MIAKTAQDQVGKLNHNLLKHAKQTYSFNVPVTTTKWIINIPKKKQ